MASIFAIRALHASSVFEELAAECTAHDVVKLLLHEFVPILLDDLFFALTNGSLSSKTGIEWLFVSGMFHKGHSQVYTSDRLQ